MWTGPRYEAMFSKRVGMEDNSLAPQFKMVMFNSFQRRLCERKSLLQNGFFFHPSPWTLLWNRNYCSLWGTRLLLIMVQSRRQKGTIGLIPFHSFFLFDVSSFSFPVVHQETKPKAGRPCLRTVWRKKVAQSSTLDQAGDWSLDLLVGSQKSYQLR